MNHENILVFTCEFTKCEQGYTTTNKLAGFISG